MRTHGLITTYNLGCRCQDCRTASADKSRRRRALERERNRPHRPSTNGRPVTEDPMRWADRGACRTVSNAVFFPSGGQGTYDLAKSICADCPVRQECLEYAVRTQQPAGCWGGLAPDERWRLMDRTA